MNIQLSSRVLHLWALAAVSTVALVACGGGGGDASAPTPAPAPAPAASAPAPVASPAPVNPLLGISAGKNHTCAITTGGGVSCWGQNGQEGALGNDSTVTSAVPVAVKGLTDAIAVAVGGIDGAGTSCAVRTNGKVVCWGFGGNGWLGNGSSASSKVPVEVTGVTDAIAVSMSDKHACALRGGALSVGFNAVCWGNNELLQLGDTIANSGAFSLTPKRVAIGSSSEGVALSSGAAHTCTVYASGGVRCWGDNSKGQLGQAASAGGLLPTLMTGFSTSAKTLSAGGGHNCAVLADGKVACWGDNTYGQLGNGTTTASLTPINVPGISNAVAVAAGSAHTCALLATGAVQCWGRGESGWLGDGLGVSSLVPVTVKNLQDAVAISAAALHTCALRANKTAVCWGKALFLGSATATDSLVPIEVTGGAVFGK
jgi:alpha-tubulin suppressor-like RCC1 family protein